MEFYQTTEVSISASATEESCYEPLQHPVLNTIFYTSTSLAPLEVTDQFPPH